MLCLSLAVILLAQVTHPIRTAFVTNSPSLVARLDKFYEKLERVTVAPATLSDDEEELLSAIQTWGGLTPDQLKGVAKDLQGLRDDAEDRADRLSDLEYADMDENDEEYSDIEYHADGNQDEDDEDMDKTARPLASSNELLREDSPTFTGFDDEDQDTRDLLMKTRMLASSATPQRSGVTDSAFKSIVSAEDPLASSNELRGETGIFSRFLDDDPEISSSAPQHLSPAGVTPSAFTKNNHQTIISAVDFIAATNEKPRIIDDSNLTALQRKALRAEAFENMGRVVRAGKCLIPQPRWIPVRQLAESMDTMFLPPCVELHRCAPDSGCCDNEKDVCAPVGGQYVEVPFLLHRGDSSVLSAARMVFFNHTTCACVRRDTLQRTVHIPHSKTHSLTRPEERQNDWLPTPTQAPVLPTVAPRHVIEEDVTAPPQMRRCTCPKYFQASMSDGSCTCACDWREASRRRECLLFSRGKEHIALRDRVCIHSRECSPPECDYGIYDMMEGKCPMRKFRRLKYHVRRHHDKNVV